MCFCVSVSLVPRVFHVPAALWGMLSSLMDRTQLKTRYTWPESYGTLVFVYLCVCVQVWINGSSEAYTLIHQSLIGQWSWRRYYIVGHSLGWSGNICTLMQYTVHVVHSVACKNHLDTNINRINPHHTHMHTHRVYPGGKQTVFRRKRLTEN